MTVQPGVGTSQRSTGTTSGCRSCCARFRRRRSRHTSSRRLRESGQWPAGSGHPAVRRWRRSCRVFAVIEHVGLVAGGVEANVGNAVSLGQARFARLDEFEVLRRRGDVPFPELVVDHDTRFGQVTDHRHLALFSFVRDVCGLLLGHDLRGVPVQRVRLNAELSNARRHRSPVDPTQPVQPRAGTGSAQPLAHPGRPANSTLPRDLCGSNRGAGIQPMVPSPLPSIIAETSTQWHSPTIPSKRRRFRARWYLLSPLARIRTSAMSIRPSW